MIKNFRDAGPEFVLPDRVAVTMTAPPMRAYTELLVSTCHRRGAFAMGGMAAFIPSRRDPEINERAWQRFGRTRSERRPMASTGPGWPIPTWCRCAVRSSTGCWAIARTSLIGAATTSQVTAAALLDIAAVPGQATEAGLRNNVDVGLRYLQAWLGGNGAVAIHNLMEDAATAEISRSQIWQWVHNDVRLDTGTTVTADLVRRIVDEELAAIRNELGEQAYADSNFEQARELFERVALADDFADFLTLPAYEAICRPRLRSVARPPPAPPGQPGILPSSRPRYRKVMSSPASFEEAPMTVQPSPNVYPAPDRDLAMELVRVTEAAAHRGRPLGRPRRQEWRRRRRRRRDAPGHLHGLDGRRRRDRRGREGRSADALQRRGGRLRVRARRSTSRSIPSTERRSPPKA